MKSIRFHRVDKPLQFKRNIQQLVIMSKLLRKHLGKYTIYLKQVLYEERYSTVYKCYSNQDKKNYAARIFPTKIIQTKQLVKKSFYFQIYVMKRLQSDKILKFVDVIQSDNNFYMIMEYADGGSLGKIFENKGKLSEEIVVQYLKALMDLFQEMNDKNIIHGNLMPSNIFFDNNSPKIGYFGNIINLDDKQQKQNSQLFYSAPELLTQKRYDNKVDIWSLGVIAYQALYGKLPWSLEQKSLNGIIKQINSGTLQFNSHDKVSTQMKDFIKNCLEQDKHFRLSWAEVIANPLFTDVKVLKKQQQKGKMTQEDDQSVIGNVKS